MPRVDPAALEALLAAALAGDEGPLAAFLREHSNLPGPRGNLELAWQFADAVTARAGGPGAASGWRVASVLAAVGPEEAPTGDPGEFLAFCGTLAAAGFAGDPSRRAAVWEAIRRAAEDERWRLREAAAQAIQRAAPARSRRGPGECSRSGRPAARGSSAAPSPPARPIRRYCATRPGRRPPCDCTR